MPCAVPIAARISSGVPKLSLLPCRTNLGASGANSSATRDFSGDREDAAGTPGTQSPLDSCQLPSGTPPGRRRYVHPPAGDAASTLVPSASSAQHARPRPASAAARRWFGRPYAKAARTAPQSCQVRASLRPAVQDQQRRPRRLHRGRARGASSAARPDRRTTCLALAVCRLVSPSRS